VSKDFDSIVKKYNLTEDHIAKITGVSNRNARAWLSAEKHIPEPALRLLLIVLGEESSEKYKP